MVQAEAEYAHFQMIEQAIERYALPATLADPTASQHQRATISAAMKVERAAVKKSMMDLCHGMIVSETLQSWQARRFT